MQRAWPALLPAQEIFAQLLVALRARRKTLQQSAQIETGASNDNWNPSAASDLFENLSGLDGVVSSREVIGGLDDV